MRPSPPRYGTVGARCVLGGAARGGGCNRAIETAERSTLATVPRMDDNRALLVVGSRREGGRRTRKSTGPLSEGWVCALPPSQGSRLESTRRMVTMGPRSPLGKVRQVQSRALPPSPPPPQLLQPPPPPPLGHGPLPRLQPPLSKCHTVDIAVRQARRPRHGVNYTTNVDQYRNSDDKSAPISAKSRGGHAGRMRAEILAGTGTAARPRAPAASCA